MKRLRNWETKYSGLHNSMIPYIISRALFKCAAIPAVFIRYSKFYWPKQFAPLCWLASLSSRDASDVILPEGTVVVWPS